MHLLLHYLRSVFSRELLCYKMPFKEAQRIVFQDLVLDGLMASKEYVALVCCIVVCKRWRQALTQSPIAFLVALPAVINTFHSRIYAMPRHAPQAELLVGQVVRNVVKGLQDHLYYRPAVKAIIRHSQSIVGDLLAQLIHPQTLARPSIWLLLLVLKVYRGDVVMGLDVLRMLSRYKCHEQALQINPDVYIVYDTVDTVVLSDEQKVTATRVVDDFEAAHGLTAQYRQEIIAHCQKVREWIAEGTLLTMQ